MDPIEVRVKLSAAVLLGTVWIILIMLPLILAQVLAMPPVSFWYLFGALFAYFFYTGIRAWRRGWKSRFVLRVVIPLALLTLSCIFTGTESQIVEILKEGGKRSGGPALSV